MNALIYQGVGEISREERAEATLENPTEVIVKNILTDACESDRNMYAGREHEAVDIVDEVGSAVTDLAASDRVILNPTLPCRLCSYCRDRKLA